MQPEVPHRSRRGTNQNSKKKNRQGDPKIRLKPKASLTSNKRNTVYKEKHNKYNYYQNRRPTGEEGAPRVSQKAARGTPHTGPPHCAIGEADPHCAVRDSSKK